MKTVFFDVDTQLDFLYPAGALYVPKAETIVAAVAHLNHLAAHHGIPVVSTTDAHLENDPEFASWPPHCVDGTTGQHKAGSTLLEKRVVIPNHAGEFDVAGAHQIILQKQTVNAFDTRNMGALLGRLHADRYVVYGVVTEICVLHAALGLLKTGKPVMVVADAIAGLKAEDSEKALSQIRAAGGTVGDAAGVAHNLKVAPAAP